MKQKTLTTPSGVFSLNTFFSQRRLDLITTQSILTLLVLSNSKSFVSPLLKQLQGA